jgi:cytochrome c-type biogenesis protein CcmH
MKPILALFLGCFSLLTSAQNLYPFATLKQEAQFTHLLKELRCLVCQNQDLADSQAGLAKDLRLQVYDLVQEGKSDGEIINYLRARYGDFILFKPPVKWLTALLWFGPALFLIIGLSVFWRACLRRGQRD